ncbi:hemolysin XhlA family protein [Kyrpidia spormannii]|uniref:hemolysin XhlA family protein n=1 Tax=Kyrpidia spormannii TaxID=2055160 RepID=UPI001055359C|nr:hemolysin XhlA family protein [Kyrpidia spormannii]
MDEQTLRRILGEFAQGITAVLENTNKEISRVYVVVEGIGQRLDRIEERLDQVEARLDRVEERLDRVEERLDRMEHRLDSIERQLGYVKVKLFEHDEEIFYLRGSNVK